MPRLSREDLDASLSDPNVNLRSLKRRTLHLAATAIVTGGVLFQTFVGRPFLTLRTKLIGCRNWRPIWFAAE